MSPANNAAQNRSQEMCVRIRCPHGLRPHVRKSITASNEPRPARARAIMPGAGWSLRLILSVELCGLGRRLAGTADGALDEVAHQRNLVRVVAQRGGAVDR